MKRVTLCADDYGQNSAISQGIIELLKLKRLSAVSCMSTGILWLSHALWLRAFIPYADIGLHFNLTEGTPLSEEMKKERFFSLSQLLIRAHLNQINKAAIEAELNAQIDKFIDGMGILPNFIDGHQHVHHLPNIRDIVLKVFLQRLGPRCYIRNVSSSKTWYQIENAYIKRLIIQYSGAGVFKKLLIQNNIPHNSSFSGIYSFSHSQKFHKLFASFTDKINDNGLIMCHPAKENSFDEDSIVQARVDEFSYLKSDQFLADCERQKIIIKRFDIFAS